MGLTTEIKKSGKKSVNAAFLCVFVSVVNHFLSNFNETELMQ
jgi:hypothetical protein